MRHIIFSFIFKKNLASSTILIARSPTFYVLLFKSPFSDIRDAIEAISKHPHTSGIDEGIFMISPPPPIICYYDESGGEEYHLDDDEMVTCCGKLADNVGWSEKSGLSKFITVITWPLYWSLWITIPQVRPIQYTEVLI
mgnify:CR=1 FL=1